MVVNSKYSKKTLSFLKGSIPNKYIFKKHPLLAGLHRGVDGALVGVIVACSLMTTSVLHSQHLWTRNFSRLQLARDLAHRLEESTAILERYFISSASYPKSMVATKSAHLLYVDRPIDRKETPVKDFLETFKDDFSVVFYPNASGY